TTDREPVKYYCNQEIFYIPVDPKTLFLGWTGYISTDSHYFTCENPTINVSNFHIVFVVNSHSFMYSNDCKPICSSSAILKLKLLHDNQLKAIYNAVYTFIDSCHFSCKVTPSEQMTVDHDTISLVIFDNTTITAFENKSLSKSKELLIKMIKYNLSGDNIYSK
ncbi:13775_t:CDS:1, partial [Funneliformis geosporum]